MSVLFVDDEPLVLRSINRRCAFHLDVTTAHSAHEALALLQGLGSFNVIVSDIQMPGLDGFDFVERASAICPEARFIFLTGSQDEAVLQHARNSPHVEAVLQKPIDTPALLEVIEQIQEVSSPNTPWKKASLTFFVGN